MCNWVTLLYSKKKKKKLYWGNNFLVVVVVVVFLPFSWATPMAYRGSQARGRIRAVAAGLHQSHSNAGVCNLHHSSGQCWILNPLSTARDRTPKLMVPSWIHFRCATTGTP